MNSEHDLGMGVGQRAPVESGGDRETPSALERVVLDSALPVDYKTMKPSDVDTQLDGIKGRLDARGVPAYEISAMLVDYLAHFYDVAGELQPETRRHIQESVKGLVRSSCQETKVIRNNALLDGLTGLIVRKYLDKETYDNREARNEEGRYGQLGLEIGMARRARQYHQEDKKEEQNLSFIILDIDHFKKINDTRGHTTGDEVLSRVAYIVKNGVREGDQVFRYGGEEIAIIARQTSLKGAQVLAEKLRKAIYDDNVLLNLVKRERGVSASFGVANYTTHVSDPFRSVEGKVTFDATVADVGKAFIRAADNALYAAKEKGRNCVEVYDPHFQKSLIDENGLSSASVAALPLDKNSFHGIVAGYVSKAAAVVGSLITSGVAYLGK